MTVPEIQQEIEQTRERLGETVEELAAKVDVRASARQKVAEVKAKTQVKAADAKAKTQVKAADVKAKTQVKAAELTQRVQQSQVVQRRWPLAVAAGVLVAGSVAVWRRRRKT
jgi:hypothetical protein